MNRMALFTMGGVLLLAAAALAGTFTLAAAPPAHFFFTADPDPYADLAIGIPFEALEETPGAAQVGAAQLLYSSPAGFTAQGNQLWRQDSEGMADQPEVGDQFGGALASGDFNSDSFADLVIGVPHETITGSCSAGALHVLYGSGTGVSTNDSQFFIQDDQPFTTTSAANDQLGAALAVGDFDGDGFDDLAVGAPGEQISGSLAAGALHVIYGAPGGLDNQRVQFWSKLNTGMEQHLFQDERFGAALASGDFNADGYADLAIGIPGAVISQGVEISQAGAVLVLAGSPAGLSAVDALWLHQALPDVEDEAETADHFGASLAAGDFNGDGWDDLAMGVTGEDIDSIPNAGALHVFYGSASGLSTLGSQFLHQDKPGVDSNAEEDDHFGWALAAGDLSGDGIDDLAVGVPYEDNVEIVDTGMVHIFPGSAEGLLCETEFSLWQGYSYVPDSGEAGDLFGYSLAIGFLNAGEQADLAIGAPGEELDGQAAAGLVIVLYDLGDIPLFTSYQSWQQGAQGMAGLAQTGDFFGAALAVLSYYPADLYLPFVLR